MSLIKILSLVICVIALIMTFRAKFIIERVFHKTATAKSILRVKYIALGLAVIAFLASFISV